MPGFLALDFTEDNQRETWWEFALSCCLRNASLLSSWAPGHRSRDKDSSAMFRLGGSVLRKHQRGFKTEKGKQPVQCAIKPQNIVGHWDLGASINTSLKHIPEEQGNWGGDGVGGSRP